MLAELIREQTEIRQVVLITDNTVADLHLDTLLASLASPPIVLIVSPGESSKSLTVASRLYDDLARSRIERSDLIITFGGGMIGDLGGFIAATWLRGLSFIQVPTTLAAAVDASVGGKTAVNHHSGKNLIGAFHQPLAVIIDTDFLNTLSQREFVTGLGESVKHAAIHDEVFLSWHEQHADRIVARESAVLGDLIARNCAIKAEVVSQDEREHGLRAILNFGHTIGHALEHLFEYKLRHGECVALGMIAVNELSCARGVLDRQTADRISTLIARLGLPVKLPKRVDPERVAAVCRMDKKVRGGTINFVLISAPGQTLRVADVTDTEIEAAVEAVQP